MSAKDGEMISGRKRYLRFPPKHTVIISFWPIYNVPWNLLANSFLGICIKPTN